MNKEDAAHTYTHTEMLLSHKKNEILLSATREMDLAVITLSEISQTEINIM